MTFEELKALQQQSLSGKESSQLTPELIASYYDTPSPQKPSTGGSGKEWAKFAGRAALSLPKLPVAAGTALARGLTGKESDLTQSLEGVGKTLDVEALRPDPQWQEEHPVQTFAQNLGEGIAPIAEAIALQRVPFVGKAVSAALPELFGGARIQEGLHKLDQTQPDLTEGEKFKKAIPAGIAEAALFRAMPKVQEAVMPTTSKATLEAVDVLNRGTTSVIPTIAKKAAFDTAYLTAQGKAVQGVETLTGVMTPEEFKAGFEPKNLAMEVASNLGMGIGFGAMHGLQWKAKAKDLHDVATNEMAPRQVREELGYKNIANLLEHSGRKEEASNFLANMKDFEDLKEQSLIIPELTGILENQKLVVQDYIKNTLDLVNKPVVQDTTTPVNLTEPTQEAPKNVKKTRGRKKKVKEPQTASIIEGVSPEVVEASQVLQAKEQAATQQEQIASVQQRNDEILSRFTPENIKRAYDANEVLVSPQEWNSLDNKVRRELVKTLPIVEVKTGTGKDKNVVVFYDKAKDIILQQEAQAKLAKEQKQTETTPVISPTQKANTTPSTTIKVAATKPETAKPALATQVARPLNTIEKKQWTKKLRDLGFEDDEIAGMKSFEAEKIIKEGLTASDWFGELLSPPEETVTPSSNKNTSVPTEVVKPEVTTTTTSPTRFEVRAHKSSGKHGVYDNIEKSFVPNALFTNKKAAQQRVNTLNKTKAETKPPVVPEVKPDVKPESTITTTNTFRSGATHYLERATTTGRYTLKDIKTGKQVAKGTLKALKQYATERGYEVDEDTKIRMGVTKKEAAKKEPVVEQTETPDEKKERIEDTLFNLQSAQDSLKEVLSQKKIDLEKKIALEEVIKGHIESLRKDSYDGPEIQEARQSTIDQKKMLDNLKRDLFDPLVSSKRKEEIRNILKENGVEVSSEKATGTPKQYNRVVIEQQIKSLKRDLNVNSLEFKASTPDQIEARKKKLADLEEIMTKIRSGEIKATDISSEATSEKIFRNASKGASKDYEAHLNSDKAINASQSIPKEIKGFVEQLWKDFGLSNKVFVTSNSDINISELKNHADYKEIIDNQGKYVGGLFTTKGGNRILVLDDSRIKDSEHVVNTVSHEVGHAIIQDHYEAADAKTQQAISMDFNKWLRQMTKGDAKALQEYYTSDEAKSFETFKEEHLAYLDENKTLDLLNDKKMNALFEEYTSQQIAKYIRERHSKPEGAVARFFTNIANKIKELFASVRDFRVKNKMPVESVQKWLDNLVESQRVSRRLKEEKEPDAELVKKYEQYKKEVDKIKEKYDDLYDRTALDPIRNLIARDRKASGIGDKTFGIGSIQETVRGLADLGYKDAFTALEKYQAEREIKQKKQQVELEALEEKYPELAPLAYERPEVEEVAYAHYSLNGQKEKSFNLLIDASKDYKNKVEISDIDTTKTGYQGSTNIPETHFGSGNFIHIRGDQRKTVEGDKVLHINELQSDWDKQYVQSVKDRIPAKEVQQWIHDLAKAQEKYHDLRQYLKELHDDLLEITTDKERRTLEIEFEKTETQVREAQNRVTELKHKISSQTEEIAPPPIEGKYWMQHAVRQIIRYAKEKGLDTITFPSTPEQVAEVEDWGILEKRLRPGVLENYTEKELQTIQDGTWSAIKPEDIRYFVRGGGNHDVTSIIDRMINRLPAYLKTLAEEFGGEFRQVDLWKRNLDYLGTKELGLKTLERLKKDNGTYTLNALKISPEMAKESERFGPKFTNIGSKEEYKDVTPAQRAALEKTGAFGVERDWKKSLTNLRDSYLKNLRQKLVDQLDPIQKYSKKAYQMSRLAVGNTAGHIESLFLTGNLRLENDVYKSTVGATTPYYKTMESLEGEVNRFHQWIAAKRALELHQVGMEALYTLDEAKALSKLDENFLPSGKSRKIVYANALKEYDRIHKSILDIAVGSGLFDSQLAEEWKKYMYIPFYREIEKGNLGFDLGRKAGMVDLKLIRKLSGESTKALRTDLMSNVIGNWMSLLNASAKNRAAVETINAASKIPNTVVKTSPKDKDAIFVYKGGKKQYYKITDEALVDALTSINRAIVSGPAVRALEKFKHLLTLGVTADPIMKVKNLIRDTQAVLALTPISINAAKNFTDGWKIMWEGQKNVLGKEAQHYVDLLASGGIIRFGQGFEAKNSTAIQRLINKRVPRNTIITRGEYAAEMWEAFKDHYNKFSDISEGVNRAALHKQLREKGVSELEAAYQARDILDFSMTGTHGAIRFLTSTIPFLNARMQGMYKMGRSYKEDPRRVQAIMAATMMASVGLLLTFQDDPDWRAREEWDRDNFWWWKIGGVAYRLPKPFELGLPSTIAERMAELALATAKKDKDMDMDRFLKIMKSLTVNTFSTDYMPQAFRPLANIMTNKDFFTGQPIEGMHMQSLKPSERFDTKTSMMARGLGKASDYIKPAPTPKQIDYLVNGYFGWLGAMSLWASDTVIRSAFNEPERPARDPFAVLTRKMIEQQPSSTDRYRTLFYEQMREIEEAYRTYKHKQESDPKEAEDFRKSEPKVNKYQKASQTKQILTQLNNRVRQIEADPKKDAYTKQREISAIRKQESIIAKNYQK